MWTRVRASADEVEASRAGDGIVPHHEITMDSGVTLDAPPAEVWPWLVQLGKGRAGWYLPRAVERFLPPGRRALRHIEPRWQDLAVGDVVPDYGGRHETFRVAMIAPPAHLVYVSRRGTVDVTWSLTLAPLSAGSATRLHLRLRLGPLRRPWLAATVGSWFDAATVAGMAAGLRERLKSAAAPARA